MCPYLSFDNSRHKQLAPVGHILEMKLSWPGKMYDVNPAEALPWLWVEKGSGFLLQTFCEWKSSCCRQLS